MPNKYVVVGTKPWCRRIFESIISKYDGEWLFLGSQEELQESLLSSFEPDYVFFLHWSWKVPESIYTNYECVCFHMTDVPYGRGGSPLQNLIVRGNVSTKLTALRMCEEMDAGPVYAKEDLSLFGGAEEIYIQATMVAADMIKQIIENRPEPSEQSGEPVFFQRRVSNQSQIDDGDSLDKIFDHIRMLDADGYPKAFFKIGDVKLSFSRPALYDGKIIADVEIVKDGNDVE